MKREIFIFFSGISVLMAGSQTDKKSNQTKQDQSINSEQKINSLLLASYL